MGAAFLCLLIVSGGSVALRDAVIGVTGGSFVATVAVFVVLLALGHEALQLPLVFYQGVTLERRYGLSTQETRRWWTDHFKSAGVALFFAVAGSLIVYVLLRWSPSYWWLAGAACFSALLVLLAQLAPVLLLPLVYQITPLDRAPLAARLLALAERAGTRVLGVFEWRMSDRTRKANAALAGLGRTRRILVSDTLLAEHSDDEIEVILAHELAHHVHRDIRSAILLETGLMVVGFFAADRVLTALAPRLGLVDKADVAGLPLILLTAGAVSLALMPLANARSRAHERRADQYALNLTRNVTAFVSAMRRLAAQNLAEERPSRLVQILFYTHPPIAERIGAARAWAAQNSAPIERL
jgi:STE24 endopeptidase